MEAICSMGVKEDNLSLQELASLAKRRTVKIINGSDMQYRHERG